MLVTSTTTTLPLACRFPATGQTTCWDGSGNPIACAGMGQDGDVRAGAPLSYTDNGDGTITDRNTELGWEKLSYDGSVHGVTNHYTWDEAFAHVAALNGMSFTGHADWRLPNVKELASIVNYENHDPAVSAAFNDNCTIGCTVQTYATAPRAPHDPWLWRSASSPRPGPGQGGASRGRSLPSSAHLT